MRRILACILFAFTFAVRCEAEDVSIKTIEILQQSIVPIMSMKPAAKGEAEVKKILGTGFLINREGDFLTAAHVVLGLKPMCGEGSFWAIYAPTVPWQTRERIKTHWFRFTECRYNESTDVAVCKTVKNPFIEPAVKGNLRPVRFGTFKNHADGSPVAFSGFPLESSVPITSKGFIASYFAIEDWFAIDKPAWPGASGSPVYDAKGYVIGILIKRGTNDGTGLAFARPIDPVLGFLRTNKIPTEKQDDN